MAVIHDIRRHLRTSVVRTQMLERELAKTLSATAGSYIAEIIAAGRNLDELLGRLALYAAASGSEDQPHGDVLPMFNSALRGLEHRRKDAEVDVQNLQNYSVHVSFSVEAVLRELLDNALKFREGPVKITVLVEQSNDAHVFGIKDTGIGFDSQYSERIMRPFERLHPVNKYEGCGLGLAICQRTLETIGGGIWAESKVNSGSTFWFSLPA